MTPVAFSRPGCYPDFHTCTKHCKITGPSAQIWEKGTKAFRLGSSSHTASPERTRASERNPHTCAHTKPPSTRIEGLSTEATARLQQPAIYFVQLHLSASCNSFYTINETNCELFLSKPCLLSPCNGPWFESRWVSATCGQRRSPDSPSVADNLFCQNALCLRHHDLTATKPTPD